MGYLTHLASGPVRRDLANHWRRLYEELRDGGVLTPDRLREIACNYGVQPTLWQAPDTIELVEDPVRLDFEPRYPPPSSVGTLQLLMRFCESLLQRPR